MDMSHDDAQTTRVTPNGVSRRNFIKGVIAGGVAVSRRPTCSAAARWSPARRPGPASVERLLTLRVNGQESARRRRAAGNPGDDAALQAGADRHQARMRPRRVRRLHRARGRRPALFVLGADAFRARARQIRPSKGWQSPDGTLHPVQQGVVDEQGFQCAFCMSGFMMATVGYLKKHPNPTREQLAHGVSGNLCRCQDYDKILTAIERGAALIEGGGPWLTATNSSVRTTRRRTSSPRSPAGRSTPKTSASTACCSPSCCSARCRTRACGASTRAPRWRCPACARILTADELPAPADTVTDLGETIRANPKGERALTDDPVYAGEPVLAVAAVDEETAAAAIEAIRVDFEQLPFVVDPIASLRPGGPNPRLEGNAGAARRRRRARRPGRSTCRSSSGRRRTSPNTPRAGCRWASRRSNGLYGDVEAGLQERGARARRDVLDGEQLAPRRSRRGRRSPTGERQALHAHRHAERRADRRVDRALAAAGSRPTSCSITEYTGGGFGSKATGAVTCMIPALLSKKANAPVMMRITREEEHYIGGIRPAVHGRVKAGFAKDGRITGRWTCS